MGKTYKYNDDETSQRRNQTEISRARTRKIKNRNVLPERNKGEKALLEFMGYTFFKEPEKWEI